MFVVNGDVVANGRLQIAGCCDGYADQGRGQWRQAPRAPDPTCALEVGPKDRGVETILGIVGDPDRVFLGVVGDDTEERTESLLLGKSSCRFSH